MNANAPKIKNIIFYSVLSILLFLVSFVLWMVFAKLESAAIAPGSVIVASGRRVVQHFEGGIVKNLLVKDGDHVKKFELLIVLENTQAKAVSEITQKELWKLLGVQARISAELHKKKMINFPAELKNTSSSSAQETMQVQQALFEANQRTFENSIDIYQQRIEQLNDEIRAKQAQIKASIEQHAYIDQELKEVEALAQKKLVKLSRLLALKREAVGLLGKQGEINANISELKQKIGETKLQIIAMTEKQRKDLLDELHANQQKLGEMLERQKTSADVLARTEIRSPISGTVMNLKFHTVGGVIKSGEPIMDIVPAHETLLIEAKLSPLDIDVVHKGLNAQVVFSGLSQRNTPRLLGRVTHVSADAMYEQATNKTFYNVDVEVPANELKKLGLITLYPGMPAEIMIITKTATPWDYFTTPIIKSFDHAFREN